MSFGLQSQPWQLAITDLFTRVLPPTQVEARGAYWKDDDQGIINTQTNQVLRLRSYVTDGHDSRQEAALASGQAGMLLIGNDAGTNATCALTYADVIIASAPIIHFKAANGSLLWNYTPFNPALNPTFNMPPGISELQNAFAYGEAAVPGISSLTSLQSTISGIQSTISSVGGDFSAIDGAVNYTDPFQTYCTLTPQKLPMLNFAAIMFLQMLMQGIPGLLEAAGFPVTLGPVGLALQPLIKYQFQPAYNASIEGTVLGTQLQSLLLSAVPGIGPALSSAGTSGGG
jgi:hypothetical protein